MVPLDKVDDAHTLLVVVSERPVHAPAGNVQLRGGRGIGPEKHATERIVRRRGRWGKVIGPGCSAPPATAGQTAAPVVDGRLRESGTTAAAMTRRRPARAMLTPMRSSHGAMCSAMYSHMCERGFGLLRKSQDQEHAEAG